MTRPRIAVVGCGLFGAAAARHLAKAEQDVTLIGPSEPDNKRAHRGVFGSHYDEGRITRKNALDPYWVGVSSAAIDRYDEIERESSVQFFTETGALMVGGTEFTNKIDQGRLVHNIRCRPLNAQELAEEFPFFNFSASSSGFYEPTRAGHVSPRRLVAAQTRAAQKHGAQRQTRTVERVHEDGEVVTTEAREKFDHVLVAAGAMTDFVLDRPETLDVYQRTVAFFEISAAETRRLARMPSLVYEAPEDPYLLPPIQYPDGRTYIKLGGDPVDVKLEGAEAIGDWFRQGGDPDIRDKLEEMIRALMPDLKISSVSMDACVTSWTVDRYPEIARLSDHVTVCTGGNGAGAKCSDELGRQGAAMVLEAIGVEA